MSLTFRIHPANLTIAIGIALAALMAVSLSVPIPRIWFVCLSWAGTGWMVFAWKWVHLSGSQVVFGAIAMRLVLLPVLPVLSDDVFRYLWDGLVVASGFSPYAYTPIDPAFGHLFDADFAGRMNSVEYFSVYPPVSQFVFFFSSWLLPSGWEAGYYGLKFFLVTAEIAAVWIMSRVVSARSLLLYAWNPLVLVEVAAQPHTEALLVLLLAGAIILASRSHGMSSVIAATLAIWTKLYPLLWLPFVLRKTRWQYLGVSGILSVIICIPFYHPDAVQHVISSLGLYTSLFEFNAGLFGLLKYVLTFVTEERTGTSLARILLIGYLTALCLFFISTRAKKRSLASELYWVMAGYLIVSTTIHPWYLLGVLVLGVFIADQNGGRPQWHWIWLGAMATGTYLFYTGGSYTSFVIAGWGGWVLLAGMHVFPDRLQAVQRSRAKKKIKWFRDFLPASGVGVSVLDLGSGEGYVGEQLLDANRAERVVLCDVVDFNRTHLEHHLYDGIKLPFVDRQFSVTILSFVLHHARNQSGVLKEVRRVTSDRVVILESVYSTRWNLHLLTFLDQLANRVRSFGLMTSQEEYLTFRRTSEWMDVFTEAGFVVKEVREKGRWVHQQALFVLEPV